MKSVNKFPINSDLAQVLMDGGRIIKRGSLTYKTAEITHVLVEYPKKYRDSIKNGPVKFLTIKWGDNFKEPKWYDATIFYSTRGHATKRFADDLSEDVTYYNMKLRNQITVKELEQK